MKKVGVYFLSVLLLVSFVSAGGFSLNFGEWFGKITGNAVSANCSYQFGGCDPCAGKKNTGCSGGGVQYANVKSICSDDKVYSWDISYKLGKNSKGQSCRYSCVATNKKLVQDCSVKNIVSPVVPQVPVLNTTRINSSQSNSSTSIINNTLPLCTENDWAFRVSVCNASGFSAGKQERFWSKLNSNCSGGFEKPSKELISCTSKGSNISIEGCLDRFNSSLYRAKGYNYTGENGCVFSCYSGNVWSQTCPVSECSCNSCGNCNSELDKNSCSRVVLKNNIFSNGSCIIMNVSKMLDCNGFSIFGNGSGSAIYSKNGFVTSMSEKGLVNCNIHNFEYGFNPNKGANQESVGGFLIKNNSFRSVSYPIYLGGWLPGNLIYNNSFYNSRVALTLLTGSFSKVISNNFCSNQFDYFGGYASGNCSNGCKANEMKSNRWISESYGNGCNLINSSLSLNKYRVYCSKSLGFVYNSTSLNCNVSSCARFDSPFYSSSEIVYAVNECKDFNNGKKILKCEVLHKPVSACSENPNCGYSTSTGYNITTRESC